MKRKYLLMGIAGALVLSTVIGGTLAALNTTTENGAGNATAGISTYSVDVTTEGTIEDKAAITTAATPGGDYACSYNVKNAIPVEETGFSIYAKVTLYKYWSDTSLKSEYDTIYTNYESQSDKEEVVAMDAGEVEKEYYPTDLATAQKNGKGFYVTNNGWLVQYADDEQIVMYYTRPLERGEASTNFMDGISFDSSLNNTYTDQTLNLEYVVDAVQANNNIDAIAAEWGMFPVFTDDGTLVGIYESKDEADKASGTTEGESEVTE